jgi:molybdate transport system substrate-binding protein
VKIRLVALATLLTLASGCRSADRVFVESEPSVFGTALSGDATVFAAASLTESFQQIGRIFEDRYPNANVVFNFGSSSGLANQIAEQGGADVFASADPANMSKVAGDDLLDGEPQVFARNRLAIVVPPGNPKDIEALADLADPGLKVVLAAPQVPAGRYAREALDNARVQVRPVSEALDVKGVIGPVTLGEADAGIVYASDIRAAGTSAAGVPIAEEHNVTAEYPIAPVTGGGDGRVARAFIDLVLSDEGRGVLTDHGFLAP